MRKDFSSRTLFKWQTRQVKVRDLYQGPPNLFLLPNQAAIVVDCKTSRIVNILGDFQRIIGLKNEELKNIHMIFDLIAPEDVERVLRYTKSLMEWIYGEKTIIPMKSMGVCHFLIKKKNKEFSRILHQTMCLQKMKDIMTFWVSVFTDISDFDVQKNLGTCVYGPGRESFFKYFTPDTSKTLFSSRELEIMKFLAEGRSSIEIAKGLKLSSHTVDTLRRNMLRKMGAKNSMELVNLARGLALI